MKYQLMIRARSNPAESIVHKHNHFMNALARIKHGWGFVAKERPKLTPQQFKAEFSVRISLSPYLERGIKGVASYQRRESLKGRADIDHGKYDDYFHLTFDPGKVDYPALPTTAFAMYVEAFEPYIGEIHDEEFTHLDFEAWRKLPPRADITRISPVCFLDRELCRRAFGLSLEQVQTKLRDRVEDVRIIANGVLIIASSSVLSLQEADAVNRQLKPLLTGKPTPTTRGLKKVVGEKKEPAKPREKSTSTKSAQLPLALASPSFPRCPSLI